MGQRGKLSSAIALQEELLQVNTTKTYILALGSLCCQAGHSLRDHVERVVMNYARQEMTRGEINGIYIYLSVKLTVNVSGLMRRTEYLARARHEMTSGVLHHHQPRPHHQVQ